MPTPSTSDDIASKRASTIEMLIASLRRGEDRKFFIGLVGYYIEGILYSASGLTVDSGSTPDIHQVKDGLRCTAMFSPNLLDPSTVRANGVTKMNVGGKVIEIVHVQLEAKLDDIYSVVELIDGNQHTLFLDPDTLRHKLKQPLIRHAQ